MRPMVETIGNCAVALTYSGEVYNFPELRRRL
ncbi:hypothetical protein ABZW96_33210 [Nocardia sp. NPDC004168]